MNKFAVAFDVGGTFVKSAVLDSSGNVLTNTITSFPADAKGSKEDILARLTEMISLQAGKLPGEGTVISGIGYAFPGPFDYEQGICYVKDADKYESLYGVNIKDELLRRLASSPLNDRLADEFGIVFENDAALFALGESHAGMARAYERCVCLTIGTGTGSAFLEQGVLVKSGEGVPPEGWIYARPYRDSIVDDYISRRGVLRIARDYGLPQEWDVKELAEAALQGHAPAAQVFERFGTSIAEMLAPFIHAFRADGVVIGGQIAKSHRLFDRTLREGLSISGVQIAYSDDTSLSTYAGVYPLLRDMWNKTGGTTV